MKEEIIVPISAEKVQKILADGGLQVTLEEAVAILNFLNKLAQITLAVYEVKPQ